MIGSWDLCTGKISYSHDAGSMIKYHKNLTSRGFRALIFRYVKSEKGICAVKFIILIGLPILFISYLCSTEYHMEFYKLQLF